MGARMRRPRQGSKGRLRRLAVRAGAAYARAAMNDRVASPHHWLDGLVAHLQDRLVGAAVESAISGPGWVSLRIGTFFVWLVARGGERLAWIDDHPLPRTWLDLLGRHQRSPFPTHLRERVVTGVFVLQTASGSADGLVLELGPGLVHRLQVRWFPRPGAIWVSDGEGRELARQGRMEGEPLAARAAHELPVEIPFDPALHASRCAAVIARELRSQTERTLRARIENDAKRAQRLVWTLQGELTRTEEDQRARATADLLAAHLHTVRPGTAHVVLTGFDGEAVEIDLDPAIPPHANLDRWYKRAGKAERKRAQVAARIERAQRDLDLAIARRQRLQDLLAGDPPLDALLAWAHDEDIEAAPTAPRPASERGRPDPERLPYWAFRLGEWEVRVGRSARDNDELTTGHSHARDLWLHAQGVTGSHVILRCAGRHVPADVIDEAARVAAHYSRARTSSTVPVLVAERRYVRKPRKAAPGTVSVERAKTLFVEPVLPTRLRRADETGEGDPA